MSLKTVALCIICVSVFDVTAQSADFLEKRDCTFSSPKRAPVHTTCVVSGGMSGGNLDARVKTPDGKNYALEGYLDKTSGWMLNGKRAKQTSQQTGDFPFCVRTLDRTLELCLNEKVD